ncbi:hypothetical protein ACFC09_05640 [Streptomyces sp. NPDC056161]|uniref:hypothetical protein n=1 Tax=Streptomyces sp. NPDC056161 TaxID=3345732 RepID=UPI0035DEE65C
MGERHSDGGRSGRRQAHRAGVAPERGQGQAGPDAALGERIGTVVRRDGAGVDPEAERRAVAAFRAARGTRAHRARTRRRDDWRRSRPRRVRLSAGASLSAVLASLALGGLAVAAIASAGSPAHEDRRPAVPSVRPADGGGTTSGGDRPSAAPSTSPTATGPAPASSAATGSAADHARRDRPATAADLLAHCRAYEQVKGRGKALDSTAWQRLVTAAGGAEKVAAYCARQSATATATASAAATRTEEPQAAAPRTAAPQVQEPQADEKQPDEKQTDEKQTEATQAPEQKQTEGTRAPDEKQAKGKK